MKRIEISGLKGKPKTGVLLSVLAITGFIMVSAFVMGGDASAREANPAPAPIETTPLVGALTAQEDPCRAHLAAPPPSKSPSTAHAVRAYSIEDRRAAQHAVLAMTFGLHSVPGPAHKAAAAQPPAPVFADERQAAQIAQFRACRKTKTLEAHLR
jgi:hypothetical protein